MSRHPLSPEVWEQALINGRIVNPGSDEKAHEYALGWYVRQGGLFADGGDAPEAPATAPAPAESFFSNAEPEVVLPQDNEAADPVEADATAKEDAPEGATGTVRRTRARKGKGQFRGDDLNTSQLNEAYVEG